MLLQEFTENLLNTGKVRIDARTEPFVDSELEATDAVLSAFYNADRICMPAKCPAYHREAAVWGAGYIFRP